MASTAKLNGILSVTVTPFDKAGKIDFDAYGRVLDFVTGNGVHYVVPCGTTGEYFNLTTEERKAVFRFVAEGVKFAFRIETPAGVLQNHHISVRSH